MTEEIMTSEHLSNLELNTQYLIHRAIYNSGIIITQTSVFQIIIISAWETAERRCFPGVFPFFFFKQKA